jgi:hypothetical protein
MDEPTVYEIRVEGRLSDRWINWFDGLEIDNDLDGVTTLKGRLVDQAALFGLLNKVHALNLTLVSVNRLSP